MMERALQSWPIAPLMWAARRFGHALLRRLGVPGVVALLAALIAAAAWPLQWRERERVRSLKHALESAQRAPVRLPPSPAGDPRQGFTRFERFLPEHREIPEVVRALFVAAQAQRLVFERGTYSATVDAAGGFARYRMTLPVTGEPQAVHGFMTAALRAHPALALQSVQFHRERSDSSVLEARIQWTLFTRLPRLPATPGQLVAAAARAAPPPPPPTATTTTTTTAKTSTIPATRTTTAIATTPSHGAQR